jgi:hypothetical protein
VAELDPDVVARAVLAWNTEPTGTHPSAELVALASAVLARRPRALVQIHALYAVTDSLTGLTTPCCTCGWTSPQTVPYDPPSSVEKRYLALGVATHP